MKEINYWKEENKTKVNSKLPNCSAKNYYQPVLNKVSTEIECDDEFFIPKYDSNSVCADVFVYCPNKDRFSIGSLGICVIDCGFSIKVSSGYKICVQLNSDWTNRGLILTSNTNFYSADLEKLKINVLNLSDKQLVVNHKDKIAKIWTEPVYFFDWK